MFFSYNRDEMNGLIAVMCDICLITSKVSFFSHISFTSHFCLLSECVILCRLLPTQKIKEVSDMMITVSRYVMTSAVPMDITMSQTWIIMLMILVLTIPICVRKGLKQTLVKWKFGIMSRGIIKLLIIFKFKKLFLLLKNK